MWLVQQAAGLDVSVTVNAPRSSMVVSRSMTFSSRPASAVTILKMEPGVSRVEMARLYSGLFPSSRMSAQSEPEIELPSKSDRS